MSDNIVTVASEPQVVSEGPPQGEGLPHDHKTVADNVPLDIWSRENGGQDYISEALNMGEPSENLPSEVNEQLQSVSDYIKSRMSQEGYEETVSGYKGMLDKVQKELGIDKHVTRESMLDRLTGYIESMKTFEALKYDDKKILKQLKQSRNKEEMKRIVMSVVENIVIK